MTTGKSKKNNAKDWQEIEHVSSQDHEQSSYNEPDLHEFLQHTLGEYQNLLVHHVEKDVKGKALEEVKEGTRLLYHQVGERLRSVELEVKQRAQVVLDRARDRIFEMFQEEVDSIFGELTADLQDLLNQEENIGSREDADNEQWNMTATRNNLPEQLLQLEVEAEIEEEGRAVSHQEVLLELPPPLDLRLLLGFYRGLSETKDVRILRTLGSLDKGISFQIRPTQREAITQLLRTLPGVGDVHLESPTEGLDVGKSGSTDDRPTVRVMLTASSK